MKKSIVAIKAKEIMVQKGLKQTAVAKKMGLTDRQLSDIMCSRKKVDSDITIQFCNALEVSPNELFGY